MNKKVLFEYEYFPTIEDVHQQIKKCEGVHSQQIAFSSFHDALTQVCYNCLKIRTNLKIYNKQNEN
jgi:hypothetical protein